MIADHAAAITYFVEAETLATRIGARELEALVWRRLGVSSSIIGRHDPGVDYLERSVNALRALGKPADWFGARNSLLNAYNRQIEAEFPEGPARVEGYRPYLAQWDSLSVSRMLVMR